MAKQRYINTRFWSDEWIQCLDPTEKLLYLYLLTNERTTIAGIYELPLKIMAVETGIDMQMIGEILKRFKKDKKILMADSWIRLMNFQKYLPLDNPSIKLGIERAMTEIPLNIREKLYPVPSHPPATPQDPTILNPNLNLNLNSLVSDEVANLNNLISLFKEVNPSYGQIFKNKTQRACLDRLVKQHTYEKVEAMIKALPQIINKKFAPRITTPYTLENKLGDLVAFIRQEQDKSPKVAKIQ